MGGPSFWWTFDHQLTSKTIASVWTGRTHSQ
jgi:hypothetical protein